MYYSLCFSTEASDICVKVRILGTGFWVLGGMSEGAPDTNLASHARGLENAPPFLAMLGLQETKMSTKPAWCSDSFP